MRTGEPLAGTGPRRLRPLDPRTYAWDMGALVERGCPLCARPGTPRFVRPDGLELCLCDRCGTYFVSPAPDEAQLCALYDGYHDKLRVRAFAGTKWHARARAPSMARPDELVRHIQGRAPLEDLRIQELASMLSLGEKRVLDVGCGAGALLWALERLGARGTGVDVDPLAVRFARERLGLGDVRRGSLEQVAPGERFDLVALQDIVEHVLRPRELIEAAAGHLEPGGLLYLWTPSATLVEREAEPLVFRADFEHLQFLQSGGIQLLASELGFQILHLETLGYLGVSDDETGPLPGTQRALRHALKRLPGFRALNRLRLRLAHRESERSGSYHLFAVLRRPPAEEPGRAGGPSR